MLELGAGVSASSSLSDSSVTSGSGEASVLDGSATPGLFRAKSGLTRLTCTGALPDALGRGAACTAPGLWRLRRRFNGFLSSTAAGDVASSLGSPDVSDSS